MDGLRHQVDSLRAEDHRLEDQFPAIVDLRPVGLGDEQRTVAIQDRIAVFVKNRLASRHAVDSGVAAEEEFDFTGVVQHRLAAEVQPRVADLMSQLDILRIDHRQAGRDVVNRVAGVVCGGNQRICSLSINDINHNVIDLFAAKIELLLDCIVDDQSRRVGN